MPSFHNGLKITDAEWMLNESQYYRSTYDMHLITDRLESKLANNKYTVKPIQGISWYNILANSDY